MSTVGGRLEANLEERRVRADEAQAKVAEMEGMLAEDCGEIVAAWARQAYGLVSGEQLEMGFAGEDNRILEPSTPARGARVLLVTLDGMARPGWRNIEAACALAWKEKVAGVILASYQVADGDTVEDASEYGVKLWGPAELAKVYREIEHEVGGVPLF